VEKIGRKISIVIPVFNEKHTLEPLYDQIRMVLMKQNVASEIIFVDDGSTDGSFEVLEVLYRTQTGAETTADTCNHSCLRHVADQDGSGMQQLNSYAPKRGNQWQGWTQPGTEMTVIQFRNNRGKVAALNAGFAHATGDVVITMDADLQDDPSEIPKLLAKLDDGYDLVSGWKFPRKDPFLKRALSFLFNKTTCLFTGVSLHDMNCGFKAYRKEALEGLNLYGELHRYIPVIVGQKGFSIAEVKVKHHPRRFGKSKYGWKRIPRGFFDLLTVLFITRFLQRPMHFFGTLGLFFTVSGFFINLYLAILWFVRGGIGFRPLLMMGILLMILGVQFFSIGFLGEMFTNLFSHFNQEPPNSRILKEKSLLDKESVVCASSD